MRNKLFILDMLFFVLAMVGGFIGGIFYQDNYLDKGDYEGLWTRNKFGFEGDWVHVNIEGMKFERAVEVCKHEVGHEIFAKVCEKNMTRCMEATR